METSGDDFESTDDLYEAIGEVRRLAKLARVAKVLVTNLMPVFWQVLHEMEEDKSEKEIR